MSRSDEALDDRSDPVHDLERYGVRLVASPRHADVLLVTGLVTHNPADPLLKAHGLAGASRSSSGGLQIDHHVSDGSATVRIGGLLVFPDAVAVSGVIKHVIEQEPSLVLLDLTGTQDVDATGIAVLVGIGGDLKNAGIQVRVIAADPRIRHRLPYTLGLRKIFPSLEDAQRCQP